MRQGRWVRRDLWLPERHHDYDMTHIDPPLLIVSRHDNWGLVRGEISEENPDYAVQLTTVGKALFGKRVRGIQIRHAATHTWGAREWAWWDHAQCRVMPS